MKKALFIKIDSLEFIIRKHQIMYVGKLSLVERNSLLCPITLVVVSVDDNDDAKAGKSIIDIFPLEKHTLAFARCDDNACRTN